MKTLSIFRFPKYRLYLSILGVISHGSFLQRTGRVEILAELLFLSTRQINVHNYSEKCPDRWRCAKLWNHALFSCISMPLLELHLENRCF